MEMNYSYSPGSAGKVIVCFSDGESEYSSELVWSEGLDRDIRENYARYLAEAKAHPFAGEPTQLDRVEAQTMYTALMTDTLL